MAIEVVMPKLGLNMEKGLIVKWYKEQGDSVEEGEALFQVETEKVTDDVEAEVTGVLQEILAEEGEEVPVGEKIAIIAEAEESGTEVKEGEAEAQAEPEELQSESEKISIIRKRIGEKMSQSYLQAPHIYLFATFNMDKAVEFKDQSEIHNLTYTDLVVKLVGEVINDYPDVNVRFDAESEEVQYIKDINIGVAVAIPEGLLVPVIKNVNKKSLKEVSLEISALQKRARNGDLVPEDTQGGTFTVSNLGMYGIDHFTAIINSPESAILSVGAIKRTPVVTNGEIKPSYLMKVGLSLDHRVLDGAMGAEFLKELRDRIENPNFK